MGQDYSFEWNWGKRLKNWTWYFAVLVILGPFIFITIIEPDWLARLIGLSLFFFGLPLVGFWFALGPKKNLGTEGRTIWPDYVTKRLGERVYFGTRILILALVGVMLFLLSINYLKDVLAVIDGDAPLSRIGNVTYTKNTLFISQNIVLDNYPVGTPEHSFEALYFPLRYIMVGKSYNFLYLPNSHIILDAKPVTDTITP